MTAPPSLEPLALSRAFSPIRRPLASTSDQSPLCLLTSKPSFEL
jgi:hypothetical protein